MSEIKTPPATPEYREGWDRVFGKKICDCEACIENRKRKQEGLPLTHETGGPICPSLAEEK